MCGLFQPIGQVRLTNVATVRFKANNVRFEIACYKNKVLNWKSGVETDIQEVLQCPYVFTSISKGKLAKNDQLIKAFGTKDINVICKQILDKGEIQVSKEERNQLLEATFKDVVTIISEVAINPQTGRPLTSTLVENTLRASAFSITLKEPAKKQALKALAHLQQLYPNDIARSQMRLKITCLNEQRLSVLDFLKGYGSYVEHDGLSGCEVSYQKRSRNNSPNRTNQQDEWSPVCSNTPTATPTSVGEDGKLYCHLTKEGDTGSHKSSKEEAVVSIRFLCSTKIYRDVDHYVSNVMQPPGALQLVSLNVKDAGNRGLVVPVVVDDTKSLPSEAKDSMPRQPKSLSSLEADSSFLESVKNMSIGAMTTEDDNQKAATVPAAKKSSAFKCTNCKMEFVSSVEYRKHCKSELHVVNSKMVLKGLAPMSTEEFEALDLCLKNSSLDT